MEREDVIILLLLWNIVVFVIYAIDKYKARHNMWRVPEKTLLLLAYLGGAVGALAGVYVIRHKTKHIKFQILVPLALVVDGVCASIIMHNS